ncbi:MAG: rRNA maturation RNase YbeY [bacterium]
MRRRNETRADARRRAAAGRASPSMRSTAAARRLHTDPARTVTVLNTTRKKLPLRRWEKFAAGVLDAAGAGGELSLSFVGRRLITRLNRRYLQRRGDTDVISFPMDAPGETARGTPRVLGDVVICLERAAKDAAKEGMPLPRKLEALIVHGVLHVMGFDHGTPRDEMEMKSEERRIWKTLVKKTKAPGR